MGAVWGQQYGLEVPNYFAQEGEPTFERPSFRRSDAFAATGRDVREGIAQPVSYTGDLGFEICVDAMEQRALWSVLWEAGQRFGMTPFGMRAMMSLRLDKFFGSWMSEFSTDYTAAETGLERFISWKKNADFIGRAAAEAEDADVHGDEPIWLEGAIVGFCTSGGFAHHTGLSVTLGF